MINFEEADEIEKFVLGKEDEFKLIYEISEERRKWMESSLSLSSFKDFNIKTGFKILKMPAYGCIFVIAIRYYIHSGKYGNNGSDIQVIGLKKLDKNYGHILIRPETFEDKISELVIKTEIDFKDSPKFSSKYFFVSDDRFLAEQFATTPRLTLIEQQHELVLEVIGDQLIARFPRKLHDQDFESMISFIRNI